MSLFRVKTANHVSRGSVTPRGTLMRASPRVVVWPSTNRPLCKSDHYALEAWERMTLGGINGRDVRMHTPTVATQFLSGHVHIEYLAYAAR